MNVGKLQFLGGRGRGQQSLFTHSFYIIAIRCVHGFNQNKIVYKDNNLEHNILCFSENPPQSEGCEAQSMYVICVLLDFT